MALIKHFSLIQLILLLSIERFLSLSLCANNYFRCAKPGLHGVYLTSPCLCCVVLSHMGALFDFTFHNIRLSTQSFLLLTPQFLPRQSQQLSQILKGPGPLCRLVWTFLPESSIWKMLHQCSKQADMMRASGWLLIPYLNLKLCLEVGFCVKTSIVIWVLCCVIVHKVKPAGVKS